MQTIYKKETISLNYLNNYVKFSLLNNQLQLYNTIYGKMVILDGKNAYLKEFLLAVMNGIDTQNLLNLLRNLSTNPTELYEYLLQNFIIE